MTTAHTSHFISLYELLLEFLFGVFSGGSKIHVLLLFRDQKPWMFYGAGALESIMYDHFGVFDTFARFFL